MKHLATRFFFARIVLGTLLAMMADTTASVRSHTTAKLSSRKGSLSRIDRGQPLNQNGQ